ncbi:MAG: hypothetical protein LCH54_11155 [Bacteroidetes bacterium]|nr:hypothetical protein [Bacteroidota bacterium]
MKRNLLFMLSIGITLILVTGFCFASADFQKGSPPRIVQLAPADLFAPEFTSAVSTLIVCNLDTDYTVFAQNAQADINSNAERPYGYNVDPGLRFDSGGTDTYKASLATETNLKLQLYGKEGSLNEITPCSRDWVGEVANSNHDNRHLKQDRWCRASC